MRFAGGPQMARFMGDSPRYDQLSDVASKSRSMQQQMNHEAEGYVSSAGLDAMAKVKASKHNARAIIAGAEADAAATQAQGMSSMIGSIASGFGSMDFSGGGGSSSTSWTPSFNASTPQFGQ